MAFVDPVVDDTVLPLCRVTDVRGLNVGNPPIDATIQNAILIASERVRSYCGQNFPSAVTGDRAFFDVRKPLVYIGPDPVSAVTAVVSDSGYIYDLTRIETDYPTKTLRMYTPSRDSDGFIIPFDVLSLGTVVRGRFPYGVNLTVSATWGWGSVPLIVAQATALVAKDTLGFYDGTKDSIDPRLEGFKVEGYNVNFMPKNSSFRSPGRPGAPTAPPDESTTGNLDADRMLFKYRKVRILVG